MAYANLNNAPVGVIAGNDSIVIVDNFQSIRGGRTLDVTGFTPLTIKEGHVIILETATDEYKPMPATETRTDGVATLGAIVGGTAYTPSTYENVPLSGGSGTGALATIVVTGTAVTGVTITNGGNNYKAGDVLSATASYMGGTGSGFSVPVATIGTTQGAYGALPAGHTYVGINIATIPTAKPFAGIMLRGTVNPVAAPYSMTAILAAVKTALPLIIFRGD